MNTPILSICFPTKNRAKALDSAISSIVSDKIFLSSLDIEIVISDNCSTDETREIIEKYLAKFPEKVFYHRNDVDTFDKNFEIVLGHGRGKFLKLQNDHFGFLPGALDLLVNVIKHCEINKPNLFLLNKSSANEQKFIDCDSLDKLLSCISYNSTWMNGFGIWKDDFDLLDGFSSMSKSQLTQVDVLFRLASTNKHTLVICQELLYSCSNVGRKGSYSISKVFGQNYLSILNTYIKLGVLSQEVFNAEKRNVYLNHILPYYFSEDYDFNRFSFLDGLEDFEGEDYFYPALEAQFVSYVQKNGDSQSKSISDLWRLINPHNDTAIVRANTYKKIKVGRKSYGPLNIHSWWDPLEGLQIGSFVSIAENVQFILGGNHSTDTFSTYPFKVKYFGYEREAQSRGKIIVSDDVWIGNGATILSGVVIGQGAIVGAGAVVASAVEPYAIYVGNPARKIKSRFEQDIIDILLQIDYSKLTDELIFSLKDILDEPMTLERASLLLEKFNELS